MWVIPLLVYSILVMYEFIPLYKEKLWRDFWVNSFLGLCSFLFAIALTFGLKVPSPSIPIQRIIEFIIGK